MSAQLHSCDVVRALTHLNGLQERRGRQTNLLYPNSTRLHLPGIGRGLVSQGLYPPLTYLEYICAGLFSGVVPIQ